LNKSQNMAQNNRILETEKTLLVLKEIEQNPQLTQRDLALRLKVSLGKVNFLINALIDKGIIEIKNFKNSKNKLAYMYMLTPEGIRTKIHLTQEFFNWKVEEYERLKQEIESLKKENGFMQQEKEPLIK